MVSSPIPGPWSPGRLLPASRCRGGRTPSPERPPRLARSPSPSASPTIWTPSARKSSPSQSAERPADGRVAAASCRWAGWVLAAEILRDCRVGIRIETDTIMFYAVDSREPLRVRPNALSHDKIIRLRGNPPSTEPIRVQRRPSNTGVTWSAVKLQAMTALGGSWRRAPTAPDLDPSGRVIRSRGAHREATPLDATPPSVRVTGPRIGPRVRSYGQSLVLGLSISPQCRHRPHKGPR
jgi:hypothetical protein